MPTTTNNGWPTPADTDLVKNGADAIRDLGQAIDTTLGVYSPVTPMGVHLSTVAFSGVNSQSFNSVFSSTYTKYKILLDFTISSGDGIAFRLRVNNADNSTANYNFQLDEVSGGSSSLGRTTSDTYFLLGNCSTSTNMFEILLGQPQQTAKTTLFSNAQLSASTIAFRTVSGITTITDSFTGFTIFPQTNASATITGTMSVYGFSV